MFDPIEALVRRQVELRVLPELGALRDAVIDSTLEFSIIRWRNAHPMQAAYPVAAPDGTVAGSRRRLKRVYRDARAAAGVMPINFND